MTRRQFVRYLDVSAEAAHDRRLWDWIIAGQDPGEFTDYERPDLGQEYTREMAEDIEADLRSNPMVRRPSPPPRADGGAPPE